jgi:hypothetical protein
MASNESIRHCVMLAGNSVRWELASALRSWRSTQPVTARTLKLHRSPPAAVRIGVAQLCDHCLRVADQLVQHALTLSRED